MISSEQWRRLLHVSPAMFRYPDELQYSVVSALDQFVTRLGSRPVILSDYRPGDPKTHGQGRAVDTTWPDRDPLQVWYLALQSRLFSGLGVYLNDLGAVSFHFDTRTDRTPYNPALWGDFITHVYDPDQAEHFRKDEYTTADAVLIEIKKKAWPLAVTVLVAFGLLLHRSTRR